MENLSAELGRRSDRLTWRGEQGKEKGEATGFVCGAFPSGCSWQRRPSIAQAPSENLPLQELFSLPAQ